jgi:hypothetical protein
MQKSSNSNAQPPAMMTCAVFDFKPAELSVPCSINDELCVVLEADNVTYMVGFGHSGYSSNVQVDGKIRMSELLGVIRGEKFYSVWSES